MAELEETQQKEQEAVPPAVEAEPAWFKAYREAQEAKLQVQSQQIEYLKGVAAGLARAPSSEDDYPDNLPRTDREWRLFDFHLKEKLQLAQKAQDEEVVQAVQNDYAAARNDYQRWLRWRQRQDEKEKTAVQEVDKLLTDNQFDAQAPETEVFRSAVKAGAKLDSVQKAIKRAREQMTRGAAGGKASRATSEAMIAAGTIEPGEVGSAPKPTGGEPTPGDQFMRNLVKREAARRRSDQVMNGDEFTPEKLFGTTR